MTLQFPLNPSIGDIFVFNQIKWRWNGYAWDRHPRAEKFENTGILYGGVLSATVGGTTFSVSEGIGQIVGYTGNENGVFPTLTEVSWGAFNGVTLNYLATADFTRLYIDSSGDLIQQTAPFDHTDPLNKIIIGTVSHIDNSTIALVTNKQHTAYDEFHKLYELFDAFGPIKKSGMVVSANGTNLSLNVSSGEALVIGLNYPNDWEEPDTYEVSASSPVNIARLYRDGSGGFVYDTNSFSFYVVIDPSKYDDNSGTLQTVNNNQWTIQRMYLFPNLPDVLLAYYGRVIYNSYSDALAGIQDEVFDEADITANNAVFLGHLVVRGGADDLSDSADAKIIPSGLFRSIGAGGGAGPDGADGATGATGATGADGQSVGYTAGNTPPTGSNTGDFWYENDTGLYYAYVWDGSTLGWLQISGQDGAVGATGPVGVETFNGLTGAVEGVSSLNGSTGDVNLSVGYEFEFTTGTPLTGKFSITTIGSDPFLSIYETTNDSVNIQSVFDDLSDRGGDITILKSDGTEVLVAKDVSEFSYTSNVFTYQLSEVSFPVSGADPDVVLNTSFTSGDIGYLRINPYPNNYVKTFNGVTGAVDTSSLTLHVAGISSDGGITAAGEVNLLDNDLKRANLKDFSEDVNAIGTVTSNTAINFENGNVQTVTVGGNCEFSFSNPPASGKAGTVTLVITNGGAYTTTFAAPVKWPGNVAPSLSSSGIDILSFLTTDGGTNIYGFVGGINFS
jgi:hypothetical protein